MSLRRIQYLDTDDLYQVFNIYKAAKAKKERSLPVNAQGDVVFDSNEEDHEQDGRFGDRFGNNYNPFLLPFRGEEGQFVGNERRYPAYGGPRRAAIAHLDNHRDDLDHVDGNVNSIFGNRAAAGGLDAAQEQKLPASSPIRRNKPPSATWPVKPSAVVKQTNEEKKSDKRTIKESDICSQEYAILKG